MDLGLQGKTAAVAAASRGLGKAAALALAREGAQVSICSRSDRIDEAAQEIEGATGQDVLAVRADITQSDGVDSFISGTVDQFGQLDILIVNAGGPPPGGFLDLTPEDWEAATNLTIMSAVRLCYAAVPHMLERGSGSIVTTQSYSVKQPISKLILSNSLRMAVIGMMKTMANELGPQGVRVNSINPTWTLTQRVEELMADRAQREGTTPEEETQKLADEIPLRRVGTLEEFGQAIAWLASPAASFIHGHALMFDGGAVKAPL